MSDTLPWFKRLNRRRKDWVAHRRIERRIRREQLELDEACFTRKRVIIVGPAETLKSDLAGKDVDSFDVVVRMNKGWQMPTAARSWMGSRTDVLFHNLNEEGARSAGTLDAGILSGHGVKLCVYPHRALDGRTPRFFRKAAEFQSTTGSDLKILPKALYERLQMALKGLQPTTGTAAIAFFAQCNLAELSIAGFTFFQTAYIDGYNDAVTSHEEAHAWVRERGHHDPELERELVSDILKSARARGMQVSLSVEMERRLEDGSG